ncbi:MAG: hypothetical protein ACPGWR_26320 [Ardenticatenaceae bacterium]
MYSVDVWGAIAASILLVQCIVFNLVFVALALGLAFGSEWIRKKTGIGLIKANEGMNKAGQQALKGQSNLAAPFVRLRARAIQLRTTRKWLKG